MAIRIAIFGAGGRMGCAILRALANAEGATLVAAIERSDYPNLAADAALVAGLPASGVRISDQRPAKGWPTCGLISPYPPRRWRM
jgi:4-hydroxy-tetrahydrodipicolinate reductase